MPVQKKEEKEEKVQAKCDTCGEEEKVQKKSNDSSQTEIEDNGIETKLNNSKGGGNKMDKNTQQEMESGFGTNFSNVKIHTDSNAVQMNQEIGAQAFTNGSDVYFNKGKYNPDSKEGKHLLAHELTHTVQQTGKTQNTIQKQKAKKKPVEVDCCNDDGITVLPFNDIEFNINDEVSSAATFCSKGSFKITSEAKWETKHKAKKYEIRVESSDSTSEILKPNRSFDIGKKETQTFKLSKTDEWGCANFRVIVKIISPKYSPMLKGKFSVLKMK